MVFLKLSWFFREYPHGAAIVLKKSVSLEVPEWFIRCVLLVCITF